MAPITSFGLLALAGIAAAIPHAHNHRMAHAHMHARDETPSQSHVSMPSCWSTCFNKYNVGSESALCGSSIGSSVKSCIDTSCKNTPGAVKQYESWASNYCSASAGATGTAASGTAPMKSSTASPVVTSTGSWTTSICTETSTLVYRTTTSLSTYLVTHTITVSGSTPVSTAEAISTAAPAPTSAPMASAAQSSGETCGDVTVTTKIYATVTVTAGAWSSETSEASSTTVPASAASPQETQLAKSHEHHAHHTQASAQETSATEASTTEASAPTSPVSTEEASTPASSPTSAAPVVSVSVGGSSSATSSTGSSSSPSATSTNNSAPFAKRGLAYNDASDCSPFYGNSQIGWAYNWGSLPEGLESSINYIPMLWSNAEPFVGYWTQNAETCLSSGASYFFSFNEPDMTSQANMSPEVAAQAWMQYMEPYAGKVKLVAPAVTNGVGPNLGVDWLKQFLSACSECTIDAVNQHWYDSTSNDLQSLQSQIEEIVSAAGGKPVFVTEFAGIGSDDEIISFMDQAMAYMDSNENVVGYSYYMVGNGYLNDGSALSPLGQAYSSYN